MGLIFRTSSLANTAATAIKNFPLTFEEGDGNFAWLATNLSGSVVSISGSVSLSGSLNLPSLTTTAQNNVITVDTTTGRLYYTASSAFGGSSTISTSSLLVTASATNNILTFTKGDNSTFQVAVDTGSLFGTSSWAQNVVSASYALSASNVLSSSYALSASSVLSSSYALSASSVLSSSYALSSSFAVSASWAPSSTVVFAVTSSGSSIYSNVPSTTGFSQVGGIFLGSDAGKDAENANNSIFVGNNAGFGATGSNTSNFIGYFAGQNASAAGGSNFIGSLVGQNAVSASNSIFIGGLAGGGATFASESIFIGNYAGLNSVSASYSIFIGQYAGAKVGGGGAPGPGLNNIVIGNGIGFPSHTSHSINIGGIIFATGSIFNTGIPVTSPATDGKVGINKNNPQYALEVSGTIGVSQVIHFEDIGTLPAGNVGDLARSGSNLYYYNGTALPAGWALIA